jgi:hypothetical protein
MGIFTKKTTKTVTFFFSGGSSKILEVSEKTRDFIKRTATDPEMKATVSHISLDGGSTSFFICWWNVGYVEIEN